MLDQRLRAVEGRPEAISYSTWRRTVLELALVFFVLALIAAVFGFGGFAAAFAGIAKFLFILFLIIAVLMLIF